jgi:hypothetical protein
VVGTISTTICGPDWASNAASLAVQRLALLRRRQRAGLVDHPAAQRRHRQHVLRAAAGRSTSQGQHQQPAPAATAAPGPATGACAAHQELGLPRGLSKFTAGGA